MPGRQVDRRWASAVWKNNGFRRDLWLIRLFQFHLLLCRWAEFRLNRSHDWSDETNLEVPIEVDNRLDCSVLCGVEEIGNMLLGALPAPFILMFIQRYISNTLICIKTNTPATPLFALPTAFNNFLQNCRWMCGSLLDLPFNATSILRSAARTSCLSAKAPNRPRALSVSTWPFSVARRSWQ
jgi:hypothetical protein